MKAYTYERTSIVETARAIANNGLTHGRTGNLSLRVAGGFLVTPTGSSLRTVLPEELSHVDTSGQLLDGPPPSKEAFLHAAMLRARPEMGAVIHTHSTYSAAVSCLNLPDNAQALPALTAYFAMRVKHLPLLPYFAPGDERLTPVAESAARNTPTLLLRNHGPIVAADDLSQALDTLHEIEQTARLHLLLGDRQVRELTAEERDALDGTGAQKTDNARLSEPAERRHG